jgi:hypothetical protein
VLSPFVGQKLGTFVSSENHEDEQVLKELIESGKVKGSGIVSSALPFALIHPTS